MPVTRIQFATSESSLRRVRNEMQRLAAKGKSRSELAEFIREQAYLNKQEKDMALFFSKGIRISNK